MEINDFIEKFAEVIEVDNVSALTAETTFKDLDEWSSLSVMILIAFFDEKFQIGIGDADIKKCSTIEDLYNLANS